MQNKRGGGIGRLSGDLYKGETAHFGYSSVFDLKHYLLVLSLPFMVHNLKMIRVPFQVFLMLRMVNVHPNIKFMLTSEILVTSVIM